MVYVKTPYSHVNINLALDGVVSQWIWFIWGKGFGPVVCSDLKLAHKQWIWDISINTVTCSHYNIFPGIYCCESWMHSDNISIMSYG